MSPPRWRIPAGLGSTARAWIRASSRSSILRGRAPSSRAAAGMIRTRYFIRLQTKPAAELLVRDRPPALREGVLRGSDVEQILEALEPFAVFHRDEGSEIASVPLEDDALSLEDPEK